MAMARLLMSLGSNLGPADKSQRNGAESVDSGSVRAEAKRREGDVRFTGNSRQMGFAKLKFCPRSQQLVPDIRASHKTVPGDGI
jgi:hypothetical protein